MEKYKFTLQQIIASPNTDAWMWFCGRYQYDIYCIASNKRKLSDLVQITENEARALRLINN